MLSNLNLFAAKAIYSINRVDRRDIAEYSRPLEFIPTKWFPALVGENEALINHGRPKHKRMSNVFDPKELEIPIDPCPKNKIHKCVQDNKYILDKM